MNLSRKVTVAPHVMARQVGDDCVILDLASGTYFGLNPVGARAWQLFSEGKDLAQSCDVLAEEYEASRDEIERDIANLAEELAANGLITLE